MRHRSGASLLHREAWLSAIKRLDLALFVDAEHQCMPAAIVARKHGISSGQFYAWRQQLLLRGALGAGADPMPSVDAAMSAPHLEPAIPAPPGSGTPTTAAAPLPRVQ